MHNMIQPGKEKEFHAALEEAVESLIREEEERIARLERAHKLARKLSQRQREARELISRLKRS